MTTYQPGDTITITADTTLYALWKKSSVNITYDDNGGSGGPGTVETAMTDGLVPSTVPTRAGYVFLYWSNVKR